MLGKPRQEEIDSIESPLAAHIIASINTAKKKLPLDSFFPGCSEDCLDLLARLLVFNPKKRITSDQALKHKYLKDFHNPKEEIDCPFVIQIPMNDNKKFSIKEYRESLYEAIAARKKDQRKKWQEKYLKQLGVQPNKQMVPEPFSEKQEIQQS